MDKFTLFELHVHDGMEFSGNQMGPSFGRRSSDDDEEYEELEEYLEDLDDESDEDEDRAESSGSGMGPLKLLVGLVVLAALAFAVKKFRGSDAELEIAELDDLSEEFEEEEAEH